MRCPAPSARSADAALQPPEDVFVAAEPAGTGLQPFQGEAVRPVEVEDVFGLGHLEGVTADPVDHVVAAVHAAPPRGALRCRLTPDTAVGRPPDTEGKGTKGEV